MEQLGVMITRTLLPCRCLNTSSRAGVQKLLALSALTFHMSSESSGIVFQELAFVCFADEQCHSILSQAPSQPPPPAQCRKVKPYGLRPQNAAFTPRSAAQLTQQSHFTSHPPACHRGSHSFFPDMLCYSKMEDSVNAELLSSNYNTQNIASLWDSCCRRREHSTCWEQRCATFSSLGGMLQHSLSFSAVLEESLSDRSSVGEGLNYI